ncbi:MAG: hypothetical protein KGJ93_04100 [Patescibacteria group bacterium]|nr:hypothetical protein [Patescibacteria group bacterium]
MSEEIKVSRPMQQPQARPEYTQSMQQPAPKSSKTAWIILAIVVVLLVVGAVVFRDKLFRGSQNGGTAAPVASGYQAVFLTNGQVYFGKLSNPDSDYVTLTDIYYLQVGPQQGNTPTQPGQTAQQQSPQISLVKLGNELHGPVDIMHINRSQVLFYEDLKEDGQVVKAIIQDKNTKK